jgi:hypothetical protein
MLTNPADSWPCHPSINHLLFTTNRSCGYLPLSQPQIGRVAAHLRLADSAFSGSNLLRSHGTEAAELKIYCACRAPLRSGPF